MMNARSANNWKDIQLGCAHTFERHMKRLVRVDVGKIQRAD